jgi:hypothetical protein
LSSGLSGTIASRKPDRSVATASGFRGFKTLSLVTAARTRLMETRWFTTFNLRGFQIGMGPIRHDILQLTEAPLQDRALQEHLRRTGGFQYIGVRTSSASKHTRQGVALSLDLPEKR